MRRLKVGSRQGSEVLRGGGARDQYKSGRRNGGQETGHNELQANKANGSAAS
jgi:hypothetical protein